MLAQEVEAQELLKASFCPVDAPQVLNWIDRAYDPGHKALPRCSAKVDYKYKHEKCGYRRIIDAVRLAIQFKSFDRMLAGKSQVVVQVVNRMKSHNG